MKIQISKKNILLALLMVVGQTAWADDGYKVTITDPTHIATDYASGISEGTTVTLTVTPVDAEYLTAADIVVIKTAPGGSAQARRRSTGFADAIPVTAVEVDARGAGTYSFDMPASDVEVSADYHDRTSLTTAMFNNLEAVTYNGSAYTPAVTSATLTLNTDYTVEYSDNTDAGTATATVTGIGRYMGTVDKTFIINKASLDGATINGIDANYAFTNSAITPEYTVTFNGVAVAETEYDAEWSDNTNVGTATLTLTATASATNFTPGTQQTATFEIINPSALCGANLTYEYDPVANTIIISGTGDMTDYNTTTNPAPWASFIDADTKVFAPTGVTVDPDAVPAGTDVFNFETNGDNVTITGYQGDNDVVEIPATVGGNTVTNIAEGAFTGSNSQPEVILIPYGDGETPAITVANNATGEGTAQLTYKEESGNITITDIGGSSDEVVIPATIDGKDVTKVDVTDAPATGTVLIPTGATTTGTLPDNTDVFAYTEQATTGDITITGYKGNNDVVEIPAAVGGKDVSDVAAGAFTGDNNAPKTILIPDNGQGQPAVTMAEGATGNGTAQFTYTEQTVGGNTTATITGYTGTGDVVEIPATIGGNDVTGISNDVFTGENAPETVFAPSTVDTGNLNVGDNTNLFTYTETTNPQTSETTATITGYAGNSDVVEIPTTIGNTPVTSVTGDDFTGEGAPTVIVPKSVADNENSTGLSGASMLTYEKNGTSGEVTITGYTGTDDVVTIPTTIGGGNVTAIEDDVFTGTNAPSTVLVPGTVTDSDGAFDNDKTDQFSYTEQTDSQTGETTATITGYTGNSDVVEVPASIGGNDLTGIAAGTFTGEGSTPTTVMIPETNESGNAIDVADGATGNGTTQLTYKEENGDITITGYTGNGGTVEIPTTVGNNPVTGIEDDVFTGENAPSTVLVPSTVTDSDGAFDNDKTDQFTYTEQTDSQTGETTATITGYTGNSDVVEVPTSVGGKDVTTVAEGAFTGDNDSPKTVLIPEENENGDAITSTGATGEGTSKLIYAEDETTGDVTITGYEGTAGSTVESPSTIGGNDVTGISSGAFIGDDAPATVLVPESAKNNVENGAFENTTGQMTYQETTDQETGASTGIEITGYTAGDGQTSVEIPAEIGGTPVTTIGDDAFAGQDVDVTVPETVVSDPATDDPFAGVGGSTGTVTHDLGGGVTMTTKTESTTKMLTVIESGNSADCANAQRIPDAVTEVQLTYQRTLTVPGSTSEMYTICLPYVPDADDNLKYYTLSDADGETLSFVEVPYSNLAANKPYLVVASSDGSVGKAMTSPINMGAATISSSALGGYQLCGTLLGMTHAEAVAAGAYILQDDGVWHKVTDESETTQKAYIPPFRAYIVKTSGGGNARLYSEFDTSTGVNTIRANEDETINNDWYTLDGRKINGKPTVKGIYIKENGEKVVK